MYSRQQKFGPSHCLLKYNGHVKSKNINDFSGRTTHATPPLHSRGPTERTRRFKQRRFKASCVYPIDDLSPKNHLYFCSLQGHILGGSALAPHRFLRCIIIFFFYTRTWLSPKGDSLPFAGGSHRTKR